MAASGGKPDAVFAPVLELPETEQFGWTPAFAQINLPEKGIIKVNQLRLRGDEMGLLATLLRAAFKRGPFEQLLFYRLNRDMDDFAAPADDYPTALRRVIAQANAQLWWRDLLREARHACPDDPDLQAFAENHGLAPQAVDASNPARVLSGSALELQIKSAQSTYDIGLRRSKLGRIEGQVCRIEYPAGVARGTGALIGPNAVLTNFHVIESVAKGTDPASSVVVRFDYKTQQDGVAVLAGTTYPLASDWLFCDSKHSPYDVQPDTVNDPDVDQLDFAILKLQGTPGEDPLGKATASPHGVARGWLEVPREEHDFNKQKALYIIQHPEGRPLQVAIDTEAATGLNGNGTRVRYTTTTQPGSSGSPCFGPD